MTSTSACVESPVVRPATTSPIPVRGPSSGVPSIASRIMIRPNQISSGSCSMASTRSGRLTGPWRRSCTTRKIEHHRGGGRAPHDVPELGPEEEVVDGGRAAERHHADAEHQAHRPRDEGATVTEQGDERLGEGEGEDERRAAEEEQGEVAAAEVELVAEEDLADGRADRGAGDDAEHAHAHHDHDQLLEARTEVVVLARAGEGGQLRQQRGLDRLEQEDRDASDEEPDDEIGRRVALDLALREHEHAERGRVAERLRGERAEEQQREVGGELRPLGLGARVDEAVLAPERHQRREQRRDREREAVPEQVVDAGRVRARSRAGCGTRPRRRGSSRRARTARCPRASHA